VSRGEREFVDDRLIVPIGPGEVGDPDQDVLVGSGVRRSAVVVPPVNVAVPTRVVSGRFARGEGAVWISGWVPELGESSVTCATVTGWAKETTRPMPG
jgi:hypothetical protein